MPNQKGYVNSLMIPLVLAGLLVLGLAVTTVMYYSRYTDHRDNVEAKAAEAVEAAKAEQAAELQAQFAEDHKSPYQTYVSPSSLGSLEVTYPRTWSAYVVEATSGKTALDGYFHPNFVPNVRSDTKFATRVTISNDSYADSVDNFDRDIEDGKVKAKALTINDVKGVRLDGQIERDVSGAMVLLPLRDKTLSIWTENPDYLKDFTSIIIAKLKFNP